MGRRKKNIKRKNSKNKVNFNNYDSVNVVRNQRDTVFRMIFNAKRELLSLYNALKSFYHYIML